MYLVICGLTLVALALALGCAAGTGRKVPNDPASPSVTRTPNLRHATSSSSLPKPSPTISIESRNPHGDQTDVNPSDDGTVYYFSCDQARYEQAAPISRGNPGYRPGLDRDGDGIACNE